MNKTANTFKIIVCLFLVTLYGSKDLSAQFQNIKNDTFWDTKNGEPIYSQGGGIFQFPHPETGEVKYFWYGVHYKQAELYREDPSVTQPRNSFEGVSCYSSTDLVNFEPEGHVLTKEEVFDGSDRAWGWCSTSPASGGCW